MKSSNKKTVAVLLAEDLKLCKESLKKNKKNDFDVIKESLGKLFETIHLSINNKRIHFLKNNLQVSYMINIRWLVPRIFRNARWTNSVDCQMRWWRADCTSSTRRSSLDSKRTNRRAAECMRFHWKSSSSRWSCAFITQAQKLLGLAVANEAKSFHLVYYVVSKRKPSVLVL